MRTLKAIVCAACVGAVLSFNIPSANAAPPGKGQGIGAGHHHRGHHRRHKMRKLMRKLHRQHAGHKHGVNRGGSGKG